jgi:hypothetical protein
MGKARVIMARCSKHEEAMEGRPQRGPILGSEQRFDAAKVRAWYLTAGTILAVTRVAVFVWVNHQFASDIRTTTNEFIAYWLYPEGMVVLVWPTFIVLHGTKYYVAWCSLVVVGSFVMSTPVLLVGWLMRRWLRQRSDLRSYQ